MKRRADRKNHSLLCPPFTRNFGRPLYRGFVPGDYDLLGRVNVRRFTYFAVGDIATNCRNRFRIHTEDRSHATFSNRNGLLHVLPAIANRSDRIAERERPSSHVSRIFAQAVPGDKSWLDTLFVEYPPCGDRSGQNCRLGYFGKPQLAFRPFEAKL